MNIPNPFKNKYFKYTLIIIVGLVLAYSILRLTILPSDPVVPFLFNLFNVYISLAEGIVNLLLKLSQLEVSIHNRELLVFDVPVNDETINNWTGILFFKRMSVFNLFMIWATLSPFKKKLIFSSLFVLTHLIAVTSALYLSIVLSLGLPYFHGLANLSTVVIGRFAMVSLFSLWLGSARLDIEKTLRKIRIQISVTRRRVIDIIILLFGYFILKDLIILSFDFYHYSRFLLHITGYLAYLFNYDGYLDGIYLIGENGALLVTKGCLGIIPMFVFAALVYLLRVKDNKTTTLYILSGLLFLMILNIARLVALFILVQGENGLEVATRHHDIYNVIMDILVFLMWIVWIEVFVRRGKEFRFLFFLNREAKAN